ncbi:DUF302 domain-containing protein [Streptomyces sp. NPDC052077]|uniref:DUF302 domain-containing protein n=1 Tax=Streptomyces sp. NPDC052077 TaxID=3154757 RepID=UPI003433D65D
MNKGSGLVTTVPEGPVESVVERVRAVVASAGCHVSGCADRTETAVRVGPRLPPTVLVLFGNPTVGTPLMTDRRTAGIGPPSGTPVREDGQGTARPPYDSAARLAGPSRCRSSRCGLS